MIRRPPRSTRVRSSAASDVYKRQISSTAFSTARPNRSSSTWSRSTTFPPKNSKRLRVCGGRHEPATRLGQSGGLQHANRPAGGSGGQSEAQRGGNERRQTHQQADLHAVGHQIVPNELQVHDGLRRRAISSSSSGERSCSWTRWTRSGSAEPLKTRLMK